MKAIPGKRIDITAHEHIDEYLRVERYRSVLRLFVVAAIAAVAWWLALGREAVSSNPVTDYSSVATTLLTNDKKWDEALAGISAIALTWILMMLLFGSMAYVPSEVAIQDALATAERLERNENLQRQFLELYRQQGNRILDWQAKAFTDAYETQKAEARMAELLSSTSQSSIAQPAGGDA